MIDGTDTPVPSWSPLAFNSKSFPSAAHRRPAQRSHSAPRADGGPVSMYASSITPWSRTPAKWVPSADIWFAKQGVFYPSLWVA